MVDRRLGPAPHRGPHMSTDGQNIGSAAYRRYVVLSLLSVYTLNFIDRQLLGVMAQPIIAQFNLSDTQYGFLNGPPFALFYALMGIPLAMAADRWNRVRILALCIALWSVMTALCGLATGFMFLLIARIGVAIGEAGCTPPANSIIGDYFRPRDRARAIGTYTMGVPIGGALASFIGGPAAQLSDERVRSLLGVVGLDSLPDALQWGAGFGWRFVFLALGILGVVVALIVLLTMREPPRGASDPSDAPKQERAGFGETLRLLRSKRSFWVMCAGAGLTALVGYGHFAFQAPMMQRLHGMPPGEFALRFGGPLALAAAGGTWLGGYLSDRLTTRSATAVAWLPAAALLTATPFYIVAFHMPGDRLGLAFAVWLIAAVVHYSYGSAQFTISQSLVPSRSRASTIAILLLVIALVGNGIGPQLVGFLSDAFMSQALAASGFGGVLDTATCRARDLSGLAPELREVCTHAYGVGLQRSMTVTTLIFLPAGACYWLASRWLVRDRLAAQSKD
jgi:predicted MFS family arabinose efflux permease